VLVNEFRDTNRRQLELLKRLVPSRDRKFPFRLALRGNRRKHGTAHGRVMRDLNLTYESHSGASENLLLSSDRVTRHNNLERLSDDEAGVPLLHVPK
jgi:hypothetical protein